MGSLTVMVILRSNPYNSYSHISTQCFSKFPEAESSINIGNAIVHTEMPPEHKRDSISPSRNVLESVIASVHNL